jgi:hypothetical protein
MPIMTLVLIPFAIIVMVYSLVTKDKKRAYAAALTSMIITFPIAYVFSSTNVYPTAIILMPLLHWAAAYFINKDKKWIATLFYLPFLISIIYLIILRFV